MGIGFVIIAWGLILGVLAVIGSGALAGLVTLLTRKVVAGRRKAILIAALFPFACWVYFGAAFIAYGAWCVALRDVDPGIGDGFWVPLGCGYYLQMIDTEDHPFITVPDDPNIESYPDLTGMQLHKPFILGSAKGTQKPFFLINTTERLASL